MKKQPKENVVKRLNSLMSMLDNMLVIFRRSRRNVPHLVIEELWSVCYFGTWRTYRVFYPYGSTIWHDVQVKKDFKAASEVAEYFKSGKYEELIELHKLHKDLK